MSAPAPAPALKPRRMLRIRLSDPAAAAYVSLLFAVLVLIFPVSFPRMLADGWFTGRLTPALIVIAGLLNAGVYLRVAHLRSAKPGLAGSAILAMLTALTLVGLMLLGVASRAIANLAGKQSPGVCHGGDSHSYVLRTDFGLVHSLSLPAFRSGPQAIAAVDCAAGRSVLASGAAIAGIRGAGRILMVWPHRLRFLNCAANS
jgi:hypothetical protein